MMTALRSRKEAKKYINYQKDGAKKEEGCAFCDISPSEPGFVEATTHFVIIRNKFPYSLWDGHGVEEHLMVVPKMHTGVLSALPAAAAEEFVRLISDYENKGYNIYARAPQSKVRSVLHQHTHLIKISNKAKQFILYTKKPYLRFTR